MSKQQPPKRLYYRAKEIAEMTGLALRTVYAHIYDGTIPSRKIGDARLVPASWLEDNEASESLARFNIPKNRYSLGNCVRGTRSQSRLLRVAVSHEMRMMRAA